MMITISAIASVSLAGTAADTAKQVAQTGLQLGGKSVLQKYAGKTVADAVGKAIKV